MNILNGMMECGLTFINNEKYEKLQKTISELPYYYAKKNNAVELPIIEYKETSLSICIYYTAPEVVELLGVSLGHAYKVIKDLNDQLKEKGYIVISGRVSKKFFHEKYYGMEQMINLKGR